MNPAFELRTTASKNLIDNMTLEELTELNNATADIKENSYTEEHKKRSVLVINDTETIIKSYHSPYIIY